MARSELDYYKILQVSRAASADEIKKSFRKLARDTHPDKNPNDPTAKERFQELQRAYDTLKDDLSRSAYDADNPYHGLPSSYSRTAHGPSTTAGARSTTAKRYTASAAPGWANGGAAYPADGFAQQSARASRSKPAYDPYGAPDYTSTPRRSTRNSGYGYGDATGFGSREYEDTYSSPKQSAYSKTRQQEARRESSPRPKSTQPPQQQKSNTSARYTQQQQEQAGGPGIDIASYIQEKRARELAKEKADQEAKRKEEHAEYRRQQKERQAREETRKAQEDAEARRSGRNAETRDRYGAYGGGDYSYGYRNSASQPPDDAGVPLQDDAEEMMRRAEEQLKASREQSRSKLSSKRPSHGRKSKTPPLRKANEEEPSIYHATPSGDTGSIRTDAAEVGSDYFKVPRPGAEYVSNSGHRVFPEPTNFDFNAQQREKENGQPSPIFNVHDATPPPPSPNRMGSKKPSPRRRKSPTTKRSSEAFRNTPDPFAYQTQDPTNANPFDTKFPEFAFNSSSQFPDYTRSGFGSHTANNSPDPQKSANRTMENSERPRSQPNQSDSQETRKPFPWSPKTKSTSSTEGFKKELFEDLLNTVAPFQFQPSDSTASPRKRRSVPHFNKKPAASKMTGRSGSADGNPAATKASVESDTEYENLRFTSKSTQSPAAVTINTSLPDPEPMDITDNDMAPPPASTTMPPPPLFVNGSNDKKSNSKIDLSSLANGLPSISNPFNLKDLSSAPPLSRSPKDVGLDGLGALKENLPFPSQPSSKPPLASNSRRTNQQPNETPWPLKSSFPDNIPPTPLEPPFIPPFPPKILKIPRATSLETYNATYEQLGQYLIEWQKYEQMVHTTREGLFKKHKFENTVTPEEICKYLEAVKREDMVLDEGFRKARKEHVKSLESWMRLRDKVIHMRSTEDGGAGAGGAAVGYGA